MFRNAFKKRKDVMKNNNLVGPLPKLVNLCVYHVLKCDKDVLYKYIKPKNFYKNVPYLL